LSAARERDTFEGDDRQYSPTRLRGWLDFVNGPDRPRPEQLAAARIAALPERELVRYNDRRAVWHANIGPIRTPQLVAVREGLAEIVESNRHDGDKAKPAALVDAYPGLGKSTAVREYGRDYWRAQVAPRGETTPDGHRRVPVIYIALTGNTRIRGLNAAICRFYGLPERGDADTLAERAKDAVLSLRTSVFLIDDIHFLAPGHANVNSVKMANHLKFLANTFPVTLVYTGVGVAGTGLLTEGRVPQQALQAQFGRRTTVLAMRPFQVYDEPGRQEWRRLLLTVERQLVLAERYPGMLADDLADYLFARSTGHFASLMALISRGCLRAIRTGAERLDAGLMDQVSNDAAAEADRKELAAAIEAGLLTARPASRSSAVTAR
jgi:AAA domain